MEYIITFINMNHAIKAEKCLLDKKIPATVMPVPNEITVGCGICLRLGKTEIEVALAALEEINLSEIELYSREEINGAFVYTKLELQDL